VVINFDAPDTTKDLKPILKNFIERKNIRLNDRINIGYEDIYKLFGKKKFFLMKINVPKGNKFIYLERFNKNNKNILIEKSKKVVLRIKNKFLPLRLYERKGKLIC
jgi:hypothetical protein